MPLIRLGIANPAANTDTSLATFSEPHLVSVIASSKSPTATPLTKVTIWVVPANAAIAAQFAYIAFNINLGVGQSFETFRFAVNAGDTLYVKATVSTVSFSCSGIIQSDAGLPENISQTFSNKTILGEFNTIYLDRGTTAERPAQISSGYVRFNTETQALEVRTSTDWEEVGTGSGSGATGPTGPAGTDGALGATGATGADGATGAAGVDGVDGATGPAGAAGSNGATGPTGPTGAQGTAINLLGSVATVGNLPTVGNSVNDAYIVTADGNLYVWNGSQWNNVGTIQGPTGPTGATGAGATGPTGPTGPGGGTVEVANTSDTTAFVGLYEDATGTIGGKTNAGITYNAATETLTATAIRTGSIQAPENLTGTYTISSPTTITLSPTSETINTAPMRLVNKTSAELTTLVASVGAVVWNSTDSVLSIYDGAAWVASQSGGGATGPTGPTGSTGASGTGSGDVIGPASSTDNAVARYDSTTGKLVQNSLATISDAGAISTPNNTGSKISFYFADLGSFPAAGDSHGAVAHNHENGKMYYAHSGAWIELANVSEIPAAGITTFSATTDATTAGITIDEVAYSAIARLPVTANGTTAYLFNSHYSGNNPTIFVLGGATIAFNLSEASHPFALQQDTGSGFSNITTGLIHVTTTGVITTNASAQGKTSGTLYWNVPITAASNGYRYICTSHGGMNGTITHKSLNSI